MVDDYGPCAYSTYVELSVNCRAGRIDLLSAFFDFGARLMAVNERREDLWTVRHAPPILGDAVMT